ncbi:MAG: tRNA preQ1(34) S-adenosylmethionine ribosyltransferase-isomerase QueA [Pseudomonadota bacterium]
MRLEEFDYRLPEELIAQYPTEKRDESRLLVAGRQSGQIEHRVFSDVLHFMEKGSVLVVNDTKVIPARLLGKKETGGTVEVLILKRRNHSRPEGDEETNAWECLVKPSRRLKEGSVIFFNECLEGKVEQQGSNGKRVIQFHCRGDFDEILDSVGRIPLPPYIRWNREQEDWERDVERYQTVFARNKGAVAAPTAGLHFTEGLISKIREKGVKIASTTIHIGPGTFMPVRVEDIENHILEAEYFEITSEAASLINEALTSGKRIIAVGTSTTRALESAVGVDKLIKPASKYTTLFIYPGYEFKIVDALITNFHLPKSTPLLLVSAFAGKTLVSDIYRRAIEAKYRFLSYGDGMMIL